MAKKDTKNKLKLNLIPVEGMIAVAKVREFGNQKYPLGGPDGYLNDVEPNDLIEACRRHLLKYLQGNLLDEESGEPHLSHAATSIFMAIEILAHRKKYFKKKPKEVYSENSVFFDE